MSGVKHRITKAERRHWDYLRRKGLQVGAVYEARLLASRKKELRRVLALCRDFNDTSSVIPTLESNLSEMGYLGAWWEGLWINAGVPMAQSTARDLRKVKAAANEGIWRSTLREYAARRAGESIVSVTGTWKETLVKLVRKTIAEDPSIGVEKLTNAVYRDYFGPLAKWQVRRIAQTETMIGMAQAADASARSLESRFVKQWSTSGLQNTRDSHLAVDGVIVGQDEPFELAGGLLMYPHDTSMGADASEIINCACACLYRPDTGQALEETPTPAPVEETVPVQKPQEALTPEQIRENRIAEIMKEKPSDLSEEIRRQLAENDLVLEEKIGVKKGKPMNFDDANTGKENPKFKSGVAYYLNCQTCVPTHEARRRGFNVEAKDYADFKKAKVDWKKRFLNPDGSTASFSWSSSFKLRKRYKVMTDARKLEFVNQETAKVGRYEIYVKWKGSKSAHVFEAERTSSGLTLFDPQSGKKNVGHLKDADGAKIGVMRIDDKIINPDIAKLFSSK